jgi:hypothetical protein
MAKYKSIIFIVLIVVIASFFGGLYIHNINRDYELNITEENLVKKAITDNNSGSFKRALDNSLITSWVIRKKDSELIFEFNSPEDINTVLINEAGLNITLYSIYYSDNAGNWQLCYRQNEIGQLRLATFRQVNTTGLKIVINDFKNTAKISNIEIYKIEKRAVDNFRLTAYVTNNSLDDYDNQPVKRLDSASFNVITDVLFIGGAGFNTSGEVIPAEVNNADKLKEIIGERDVHIFATIFNPGNDTAETIVNHKDLLIENVVDYIVGNDFYGVDFDWEFPRNQAEYDIYSDFLIELKSELTIYGKKLSLALAPWGLKFSQEAIDCIDQVQIMAYDLYDQNGDNNSFNGSAVSTVNYMLGQGFTKEQLNLGISYYGRPNDASFHWYDYKDERFTQDEYIMFQYGSYFNTITTSRDRTVYAILRGLGGIMTFALHEDLPMDDPLCLTAEIGNTINEYVSGD